MVKSYQLIKLFYKFKFVRPKQFSQYSTDVNNHSKAFLGVTSLTLDVSQFGKYIENLMKILLKSI